MTEEDINYIFFYTQQAQEAEEYGLKRNICCRNLNGVLQKYRKVISPVPIIIIRNILMDSVLDKEFIKRLFDEKLFNEICNKYEFMKNNYDMNFSYNLNLIMFAIEQAKTLNLEKDKLQYREYKDNLAIAISQYWEKDIMGISVLDKKKLPRNKNAQKQLDDKGHLKGCIAEHVVPKSFIINLLIENPLENAGKILKENLRVVLVTAKDDELLNEWKDRMPDDWETGKSIWARYEKAGVDYPKSYPWSWEKPPSESQITSEIKKMISKVNPKVFCWRY